MLLPSSTIVKMIGRHHLRMSNRGIALAYLYCDPMQQNAQTAENIIAIIIRQLARASKGAWTELEEYRRSRSGLLRGSINDLYKLATSVLSVFRRVYLVVDSPASMSKRSISRPREAHSRNWAAKLCKAAFIQSSGARNSL